MLDFLLSLVYGKSEPESSPPELQTVPVSEEKGSTWVYVWKTTKDDVGHVGIAITSQEPEKCDESTDSNKGVYVSIHPTISSVGITTILPVPAVIVTTPEEDMKYAAEARHKVIVYDTDTVPTSVSEKVPTSLPPDQIIQVNHLDTAAMLDYIDQSKQEVSTGERAYQLFPNVDALGYVNGLIQDAPALINMDPVDAELQRSHSSEQKSAVAFHANNCATYACDILEAGGLHLDKSNFWGVSPGGLADQLIAAQGERISQEEACDQGSDTTAILMSSMI